LTPYSDHQLAAASLAAALPRPRAFEQIAAAGGPVAAWSRIGSHRYGPQQVQAQCERFGLSLVSFFDDDFPAHLRHIPDPPLVLYLRGQRGLLDVPGVAVVGARRCTRSGAEVAAVLGADLASVGLTVISGLALGIDSAAHRGALNGASSHTVPATAVLGSGLSEIYPRSNTALAQQLVARGGLLVSEYPPGLPPAKHQFPERNRLISALSLGVVIVEAGERSGSLITARMALEQGREVLAVPGSVVGGRSRGCHRMLKQGAALVESARDVCEALGIDPAAQPALSRTVAAELAPILGAVEARVRGCDEIAHAAGVAPEVAMTRLLMLELEGFVAQVPGGYILRPARG
jgi:DNA processing protein